MGFLVRILISVVAVYLAARFVPGITISGGITTTIIVAVVLGVLNAVLKPILVVLTIPITVLTLGLFYFVINVIMVYLTDSLVAGFSVRDFIAALLFSIVVSVVTWIIDTVVN